MNKKGFWSRIWDFIISLILMFMLIDVIDFLTGDKIDDET